MRFVYNEIREGWLIGIVSFCIYFWFDSKLGISFLKVRCGICWFVYVVLNFMLNIFECVVIL